MGEDPVAVLHQGQTVFRDGPAHFNILPVDGKGGLLHGGPGFLDGGGPLRRRQGAVQHVLEVHRRGTGGIEIVPVLPAPGQESGEVLHPGAEGKDVKGIPGEDADGGSPPDPEGGNGFVELLRGGKVQIDCFVGQQALVQDADGPAAGGQGDVVGVGDGLG